MIRMHNVHPATHYDSSATKRTQEEVMRSRQVTVYARQHPRYRKYRQSTEAA